MSFSTAGGGPSAPQMNVTPLIDVLLVLIIIFMIVVIEQKPAGLEAQIPQKPNPADHSIPPPDTTIIIQVRDGKTPDYPDLKINNEVVAVSDLRQRLFAIFSSRVERIAYIKADDDIDFQQVADVIDTAHDAGIDRVGLLHDEAASAHPSNH
jgi:biopolymer transport protein TolR